MNFNQWKLLNYLKDSLSKLTTDKQMQVKDIVQIFSRFPSSEIVKIFDTKGSPLTKYNIKLVNSYLPGIFSELSRKISKNDVNDKQDVPKWKDRISQKALVSCEDHLLLTIDNANTDESKLVGIEDLIAHIKMHPEARNKAIKMGAVRLLLQLRRQTSVNTLLEGTIREALALLGHADPVPGNGVRILSIDGGGIRGILVLEMLKKLEELTGKKVHELFDFVCGVSTGTILSFAMAIHHVSLDEISKEYERISNEVFKQSPIWGTGSLVWSHAYYNTTLWESKLQEYLGHQSLIGTARDPQCPKLCAISAVVNQARVSAFVFRNYTLPWRFQSQYQGTWDCQVWQAARASAAAPTYFEEYKLGTLVHQDGGILVNNPTAIAIHEAKQLWPNTPIQCIVSFGTGRTVQPPSEFSMVPHEKEGTSKSTSWSDKFFKILDSATDTEGVHTMLSDLLPPHVYYRFNPYLNEMVDMVEIDSKKLEQLRRDALMYLRRNEDKFQEAAKCLTQEKGYSQKIRDFVNVQREILDV